MSLEPLGQRGFPDAIWAFKDEQLSSALGHCPLALSARQYAIFFFADHTRQTGD